MPHDLVLIVIAAIGAAGAVLAARTSHKAVKQTKPISNGFAGDVTKRLDRIETLITNHIEQHAAAEIKRR